MAYVRGSVALLLITLVLLSLPHVTAPASASTPSSEGKFGLKAVEVVPLPRSPAYLWLQDRHGLGAAYIYDAGPSSIGVIIVSYWN